MAEIIWTNEAVQWLDKIYAYISADNETAASRVIEGIYHKVQLLRRYPQLGARYDAIDDKEVRVLLYGHYRIVYLVKSKNRIDILGVFHAAMNIANYLH